MKHPQGDAVGDATNVEESSAHGMRGTEQVGDDRKRPDVEVQVSDAGLSRPLGFSERVRACHVFSSMSMC